MREPIVVLSVVGARPQFVKAAPISAAFRAAGDFREVVVHTGQHFDREMSDVFFSDLDMAEPAVNLGIHGGLHGEMTGRMLAALEQQIAARCPDWVLVYGDTNSTLAAALAAAKMHIRVAHVEAGLRSYNRAMPEEVNRVLTDHVSTLLCCPTNQAVENLAREGITEGVHWVGDVMYDACLSVARRIGSGSDVLDRLGVRGRRFDVATVHRAENVDSPERLRGVVEYLRRAAEERSILFPIHPRTREALRRFDIDPAPLQVCEPVGYLDMATLLVNCTTVFTDSGGLQKEAYFYGKPCVTLRDETEWVETVANGWNRLWRAPDYAPRHDISEYGDGRAAARVVSLMRGRSLDRPADAQRDRPESARAG